MAKAEPQRRELTDRFVKTVKPGPKRTRYWDTKQPIDFLRQSDASTPREMHRVPLIIHAQPERSRGT